MIFFHRISRVFYTLGLIRLSECLDKIHRVLFGFFIPGSSVIGKNTKFGYGGLGVVVHKDTKIGNNCLIGQNVTIGKNIAKKGVPHIGNCVYIGAGSVVFGNIIIGDNVIIGANSVVNRDCKSDSVYAGNPAEFIRPVKKEELVDIFRKL